MLFSNRMMFLVVISLSLFAASGMAQTLSEGFSQTENWSQQNQLSGQEQQQQNPAMMQQNPAMMWQNPALMQQNPALMQQNPAMMQQNPALMQQNPALMQQNPALMQQNPALMQQNPAMMQQNPALMQQNPAMMQQNPAIEKTSTAEKFFSTFPRAVRQSVANIDNVNARNSLILSRSEQVLKQFGYDFFTSTSGFVAAPFNAPVGEDYVLAPGDTLSIMVWGAVNATHAATVDRQGEIILPGIGAIPVWGQRLDQARQTIRQHFSKYHKDFEMNISMGALRTVQVYLVGEVVRPGTVTVSSLSTVLNVLSVAGGPAKTGSLRDVQLLRQGKVVAHIDYYDFLLNGDRSQDVRIMDGDTLFVPVAHAFVGMSGEVRRPAIYELKPGETLDQLLRFAGGVNSTAYLKQVRVERIDAHVGREVISLNLEPSKSTETKLNVPLQDRDLVSISSLSPVNDRSVLLSGYVARPGRYPLNEGMRLSDLLLSNQNLLPGYYPGVAEVLRLRPPLYLPERLSIDLAKALALEEKENLLLEPFDEVRIFSTTEMEEIPAVRITGAVLKPGEYRLFSGMKVKDLIVAAGNLRRSASMLEAELTRYYPEETRTRTERISIALDRALQGDEKENIVLQPDDALVVRSIPDFGETLSVTLQGEVLYPGIYSISRGERLSSVLARAGGFTADAYLRGATFTRESVKALQKVNIEKLITEQEFEIMRASQEMASKATSPEELTAAQEMLSARQLMLTKLKQTPVLGRMVLHFQPLEKLQNSDDDVDLMDGDLLMVPKNPQVVTVLGKVYNENSLIYRPGKSVAYYLDQVGGTKEEADEAAIFVVRADGTVISKAQGGGGVRWDSDNWRWIVGGFYSAELFPGDAILVPEKIDKSAVMRDVKDISTIFYQMALGAAAIASF